MKILVLMAGRGQRFIDAGYNLPKPLININGKPMIQHVIENIGIEAEYIFLTLKEHCDKYMLRYILPLICDKNPCKIIEVDQITEGAACTALLAKDNLLGFEEELLIINSDQLVFWDPNHFINYMRFKKADGGILTFTASNSKWSFVKLKDETNLIIEVAEKKPISNTATVGIYYFKSSSKFVQCAKQMINKNIRTNNEFYLAPSYNELIEVGGKVYSYPVAEMIGLGTPVDLEKYLNQ